MTNLTERSLGYGRGILRGALVVAGALISLVVATIDVALGRGGGIAAGTEAEIPIAIGGSRCSARTWATSPGAIDR